MIVSASSSSATTSLWAMINQLQMLMLLVLVKGYISSNTREYLLGQKFVMVNIDFFEEVSGDDDSKSSFFNKRQNDPDLKDIGIKYLSAFRHILSVLVIFVLAAVMHLFFYFAARDEDSTDLYLVSRVYYWIRRKVLYTLKYVFYLRLMLE